MKAFIIAIAILSASPFPDNLFGATGRAPQVGRELGTCEGAAAELARFDKVSHEWGSSNEGDPYTTLRHYAADGEWIGYGVTIYRSKSRFASARRRESSRHVPG